MKIAICAAVDLSGAGGVETHILQLSRAMRKQGAAIDVFADNTTQEYQSLSMFEPQGYDIIHTHGCSLNLNLYRKLLHCAPEQRRVHTLHGISLYYLWACKTWWNWRCYWSTLIEGLLSRAANHTICVSQNLISGAENYFGISSDQLSVMGNGVDLDHFEGGNRRCFRQFYNISDDDLVVIFVGRGEDRVKGTTLISACMENLYHECNHVKLMAVPGSGFQPAPWLIQTGHIDLNDMRDLYAAADICMNASLNEGMPITLIEAMAAGLPVIASPVGGIVDLIKHGDNGLLLRPDRADLLEQLKQLINNPDRRAHLGTKARNSVRQLSWSNIAQQTMGIYESILP